MLFRARACLFFRLRRRGPLLLALSLRPQFCNCDRGPDQVELHTIARGVCLLILKRFTCPSSIYLLVALFSTLPPGQHNKKAQNLPLPLLCVVSERASECAACGTHRFFSASNIYISSSLKAQSEILLFAAVPSLALQQFPPCWFAECMTQIISQYRQRAMLLRAVIIHIHKRIAVSQRMRCENNKHYTLLSALSTANFICRC